MPSRARLDPREVAVEHPLPGRTDEASLATARRAAAAFEQARVLDLVERVRHHDGGRRECLRRDERAAFKLAVEISEAALRPTVRMRKSVEQARNLGRFNQSLQHVLPEVLMKQKKLKSHRSLRSKLR